MTAQTPPPAQVVAQYEAMLAYAGRDTRGDPWILAVLKHQRSLLAAQKPPRMTAKRRALLAELELLQAAKQEQYDAMMATEPQTTERHQAVARWSATRRAERELRDRLAGR